MSRSNTSENSLSNPAVRWFEWNGEAGTVRYYDKEAKKSVDVGSDFSFMLLDQLSSVKGWHDASQSGIYSNEVKDTRTEPLTVKSFKGGVLAEGLYRDIRESVTSKAVGGQFVSQLYIAFEHEGEAAIGVLGFKGAALGAWMEFTKANRSDLYSEGIRINGFTEGKKGRIVFRVPVLEFVNVTDEQHASAVALDQTLQEFFKSYLKRNKSVPADSEGDDRPNETDEDAPF